MLEFNTTITFPAAPLLTVILALVGKFLLKVEKILKGSLDSIPSPTPSVKIQIMGGKVCLQRCSWVFKSGQASSNVVGIICPPGCNRDT